MGADGEEDQMISKRHKVPFSIERNSFYFGGNCLFALKLASADL